MDKNQNITLVFPPLYCHDKIYPSIYYLSSFLKASGYSNVTTINHTQTFFEFLLSEDNSEQLLRSSHSLSFLDFHAKLFLDLDQKVILTQMEAQSYVTLSKSIIEQLYLSWIQNNAHLCRDKIRSQHLKYLMSVARRDLSIGSHPDHVDSYLERMTGFFERFFESTSLGKLRIDEPTLIGISIMDQLQLVPTYIFLKRLRKEHIHSRVFLGGPFLSKAYPYILENFSSNALLKKLFEVIDGIVLFEGELVMRGLLENLDDPSSLGHIPNLILRTEQGITFTGIGAWDSEVFQNSPAPDFSDLNLSSCTELPYLVSRGCYYRKCTFCKSHSPHGVDFVSQDPSKVLGDLVSLQSTYRIDSFDFCDEALPLGVMRRVCQYIKENNVQIRWRGNCRFEKPLLDMSFCKELRSSGCYQLQLGLESGCQRILELMNKNIDLDRAQQILVNLKEAGIRVHLYVLFGFPGETDDDAAETIRFLETHQHLIHSYATHEFSLERDSPVHRSYPDYGITSIKELKGVGALTCVGFAQKIERCCSPKMCCERVADMFRDKHVSTRQTGNRPVSSTGVPENTISFNFDIDRIRRVLTEHPASSEASPTIERCPSWFICDPQTGRLFKPASVSSR